VGGLTDWTPRDFNLKLDFLEDGQYSATLCRDGINAEKYPADFEITSFKVTKQSVENIHLAPGGGFMLKIIKK